MVELTSPWISSDEINARLDGLTQKAESRRSRYLHELEASVARLGVGTVNDGADAQGTARHVDEPAPARRSRAPEPEPFVDLPSRTTHGGPFGPTVRAKLIAEALTKRESRW